MSNIEQTQSSPAPRLTGKGYTMSEVRRALTIVLLSWVPGSIFVTLVTGVVFTAFLTKYLATDDFTFGVLTSIGLATVVFQLLGSYIAERTGRAKKHFIIFFTLYRFLWVGLAAIPLFMMHLAPITRFVFIGCLIGIGSSFAYFGNAGWSAWIADIVPKSSSGKFFGMRSRIGLIAAVVTSLVATRLIDHFPKSGGLYAIIFIVAGVLGAGEILCYLLVREIPRKIEEKLPAFGELLVTPWKNAAFRSYALYTSVVWIAYMMMGNYVTRYCLLPISEHGLGMSAEYTNFSLGIVFTLVMAILVPFWGGAIDRLGPKSVLATSSLAQIIFPLMWLFMRPEYIWLIPFYGAIIGITWPGIDQVIVYMQMKGFPEERRTTYIAAFGIVFGLSSTIGNLLGGVLASFWETHMAFIPFLPAGTSHYHLLFLSSIVLRLVAFVFIFPRMPLPGRAGHRTVARTIAGDATASLPRALRRRRTPSGNQDS